MGDYQYILAFGSNLGNREFHCRYGEEALKSLGTILRFSRHLYTDPLESPLIPDTKDQDPFLNYILEFQSSLTPLELYAHLVRIENERGHNRVKKWAPRGLDIDILMMKWKGTYCAFDKGGLQIPHPEIKNRPFLLDLLQDFEITSFESDLQFD